MAITKMQLAKTQFLSGLDIDKFFKAAGIKEQKGYLFHGTKQSNLKGIAKNGIVPTDKSLDGKLAAYAAGKWSTASIWSPLVGGVMLRIKKEGNWKETDNKVFYTYDPVPPRLIEVLTTDGWVPVRS